MSLSHMAFWVTKWKYVVHECNSTFQNKTLLDLHAKQSFHAPFAYRYSKTFSRQDCLARHLQKFNLTASFPCPYCEKHDGKKAFKRRDHLTQHLRGHQRMERETLTSTQSGRARSVILNEYKQKGIN
ncbi:hypothetical protein NA56DRAFT_705416 [Hyaloscypha hepaticicola]|uniref:Uncharacterized protein n=1 Tax=Hyaloscypha hepaticicola TaxID=2082293 RepID=A0A2J6Q0K1_9HELO|nr:hypothetical protein NA56DRAFT_705416 [Hyaloscypha hepaticicola]